MIDTGPLCLHAAGPRVTLVPGVRHELCSSSEECVIGKVATANGDLHNSFFLRLDVGRFPHIQEEGAAAVRLISG